MLRIIRFLLWLVGVVVLAYFLLVFFGYEINKEYFNGTKKHCQEKLKECTSNFFHQGVDNAKCDFNCIDPKLIIKKK